MLTIIIHTRIKQYDKTLCVSFGFSSFGKLIAFDAIGSLVKWALKSSSRETKQRREERGKYFLGCAKGL